ncbi:hypothetical protein AB0I77_46705 [Streptomyces sp. NPDC050619]|uniref:hypothetical protein n=1 Tax=Streptomyces sp. NPDC050619 TaxID=3157214 RepID=UPI003433FD27
MREHIAGFCELLLLAIVRALLPAQGRHRAARAQHRAGDPPLALAPDSPRSGRPLDVSAFERDTPLVRPYLLTPEERREHKLRIRGMEVPA